MNEFKIMFAESEIERCKDAKIMYILIGIEEDRCIYKSTRNQEVARSYMHDKMKLMAIIKNGKIKKLF